MNCPPVGNESGLVGYWNFEEGSGNTVFDQTNNGNNGIINGASYNTNVPLQSCSLTTVNGCDSTAILNLTINQSDNTSSSVISCDSYTWDGNTYSVSGTYTNVYTNSVGCDSTHTLNLTINNSSTGTTTVTACDSYIWDGNTYSVSGIYTNVYTNSVGCDSVHTLNLTINNSNTGSSSVTVCDSYLWDGVTYTTSGTYSNTYTNTFGCDSIHTLNLTINQSDNTSSSVISCDSYTWDGVVYTQSGIYSNIYTNVLGCDSIHTLNLTINNSSTGTTTVTACDSYIWDGNTYSVSGIYTNVYTNSVGCDSTHTLNLTINYSNTGSSSVTVCDSYLWNGVTYTTSGTYSNTYTNNFGCDSIHTLSLTINQSDTSYTNITACDSLVWNGITYDSSGTYVYANSSNNSYSLSFDGTTSYVSTNIQLSSINSTNNEFTFSAWLINYGSSNNYLQAIFSSNGGLFYVGLWADGHLYAQNGNCGFDLPNVVPPVGTWYHFAYLVRNGTAFVYLDGVEYTVANCNGYLPSNNHLLWLGHENEGNGYYWNGNMDDVQVWDYGLTSQEIQDYIQCSPDGSELGLKALWNFEEGSGNIAYDQTTNNNNGTIINSIYDLDIPIQTCQSAHLTTVNGCDSTAILNLTINQSDNTSSSVISCDSYTWDGNTYLVSGTYTNVYTNSVGCDSTHTLNLTINNSSTGITTVTACDSYIWDGNTYSVSGIYTNVYTNSVGCDSTHTLNLTINNSNTGSSSVTVCDSYLWNGVTYTTSGTYSNTYTNNFGCDSIHTLSLTINQSDTSYTNITACDSLVWNGVSFDSSGTYYYNGENNNYSMSFDGVDDFIEIMNHSSLNLDSNFTFSAYVLHNNLGNNQAYKILDNGISGQACPSYNFQILNNNSINARFFNSTNCSSNDPFWNNNQSISSISEGVWKYITVTYDGVNLKFYIDGNLDVTIVKNGVVSYAPIFNLLIGAEINSSGNYINTFNGNIDNLQIWNISLAQQDIQQYMYCPPIGDENGLVGYWNFEEGPASSIVIDQTNNNNNGIINGTLYSTNTPLQSCNLTNINGCDSTAVLNLTINHSDSTSSSVTSCDSYIWDGVTYNTSGTYSNIYTNVEGCDSIHSLNLIINFSDTSFSNLIVCDSIEWNGNIYTQSGTYYSNGNSSNNYAMNFDGINDIVTLPSSTANNLSSGTIMAWVKLDEVTGESIFVRQHNGVNTYARFSVGSQTSSSGHASVHLQEFYISIVLMEIQMHQVIWGLTLVFMNI